MISTWEYENPPRLGWRYRCADGGTIEAHSLTIFSEEIGGGLVETNGIVRARYTSPDGESQREDLYILHTRRVVVFTELIRGGE